MSNSKAFTFAETMCFDAETRMHVTVTRAASGDARQLDRRSVEDRRAIDRQTHAGARPRLSGARATMAKTLI
jgi:hypothetical protein